jgi:hypothetical protein
MIRKETICFREVLDDASYRGYETVDEIYVQEKVRSVLDICIFHSYRGFNFHQVEF